MPLCRSSGGLCPCPGDIFSSKPQGPTCPGIVPGMGQPCAENSTETTAASTWHQRQRLQHLPLGEKPARGRSTHHQPQGPARPPFPTRSFLQTLPNPLLAFREGSGKRCLSCRGFTGFPRKSLSTHQSPVAEIKSKYVCCSLERRSLLLESQRGGNYRLP